MSEKQASSVAMHGWNARLEALPPGGGCSVVGRGQFPSKMPLPALQLPWGAEQAKKDQCAFKGKDLQVSATLLRGSVAGGGGEEWGCWPGSKRAPPNPCGGPGWQEAAARAGGRVAEGVSAAKG